MKTLLLAALMAFSVLGAFAQQELNTFEPTPVTYQPISPVFASAQSSSHYLFSKDNVKCDRFTKMNKAGKILWIVGTPVAAAGLSMIIAGVAIGYSADAFAGTGLAAGGAATFVVGLGCIGAGVPLYIIGRHNVNKYCSINLQQNKNGIGLACNF
ncbi:MAG: hypothetical protein U0T84_04895 [Chitinophagales bacterium]